MDTSSSSSQENPSEKLKSQKSLLVSIIPLLAIITFLPSTEMSKLNSGNCLKSSSLFLFLKVFSSFKISIPIPSGKEFIEYVPENFLLFDLFDFELMKSKFSGEFKGVSPHKILPKSFA